MAQLQSSSQKILAANQLVLVEFQIPIGNYNLKTALSNLSCPKKCKIIGEIIKDYLLCATLTSSTPAPMIYMKQFWYTVKQVADVKETIMFNMDQQVVDLTLDMFCTMLQLPQVTTEKPFVPPVKLITIQDIFKILGCKGPIPRST
ncbi:hypothetical protein Tco_0203202, partial [Tanacetum coccineum]